MDSEDCPAAWDAAAITALDENRVEWVSTIFRRRDANLDARIRGGCYGRFILARRGYRNRKLGPTPKAFEAGDTLL